MRKRLTLVENVWLPAWERPSATRPLSESGFTNGYLTEDKRNAAGDVKKFGLSESEFLAVVPTELGLGGVVNLNDRIYPSEGFAVQNATLHSSIAEGFFSPSEAGHPQGMQTLNVAARLMTIELEDGDGEAITLTRNEEGLFLLPEGVESFPQVVKATGNIAFLRTQAGEDTYCLYRAGMPLGMSSVSFGIPVPHELGEDSPYLSDNLDHAGKTIDVIEEQELERYDIVTVPSAGTYLSTAEAQRAYESLRESANFPALPPPPTRTAAEEISMTLEELLEKFPTLTAKLSKEAADSATTKLLAEGQLGEFSKLTDAAKTRVLNLGTMIETGDKGALEDDELGKRIGSMFEAAAAPLRTRLTQMEAKVTESDAARLVAEGALTKLREAAEKAEAIKLRGAALATALEGIHSNLRGLVEGQVKVDIDAGRLTSAEDIAEAVKRTAEFAAAISKTSAKPQTENVKPGDAGADKEDGESPTPVIESNDRIGAAAAVLLGENWVDGLAAAMNIKPAPKATDSAAE